MYYVYLTRDGNSCISESEEPDLFLIGIAKSFKAAQSVLNEYVSRHVKDGDISVRP